jgi:hypothetical protein
LSPTNESRFNLNPTSAIDSHAEYQDMTSITGYKYNAANKTARPNSTKKSEMITNRQHNLVSSER